MIVKKSTLLESEYNLIENLAKQSGLLKETVTLLYNRGVKTLQDINDFINPSKQTLHSPFLLKGVSEAVERIEKARDNNEIVVIFGDYDADGICATTLLYKALLEYGISAITIVPERKNGYGLREETIDEIVGEYYPDLIITVDCGISAYNEVEYLKDLGVDVIITDHHEIPEKLPNTITINCKIKEQEYAFDGLCGAGVSYKLAYALIGEKANKYLDYVAIATIADSMPLIDENRFIVIEGMNIIRTNTCAKAIKTLVEKANIKDITTSSIAYGIVPRINGAGRMDDAYSCLKFFISEDENEMQYLSQRLIEYNVERQEYCDKIYKEAKEIITKGESPDKIIVVYKEGWQGGVVGIISARITEEYNLPSIVLAGENGIYHGSARSIEGMNLFEIISDSKDLLVDFGGHAQACGLTVKEENIDNLIKRLKEYIAKNCSKKAFEKIIEVEDFINDKISLKFAKEIALLEPFGIGNTKPLFATSVVNTAVRRMKNGSPHLIIPTKNFELIAFSGEKYLNLLACSSVKNIVFEIGVNYFNNKESVVGYVKNIEEQFDLNENLTITALLKACKDVLSNEISGDYEPFDLQDLSKINTLGYGTLLVVTNSENLTKFDLEGFKITANSVIDLNGKNVVKVGGVTDEEAFLYKRVIFLDKPLILPKLRGVINQVNESISSYEPCLDREDMIKLYKQIVNFFAGGKIINTIGIYREIKGEFTLQQVVMAFESFKELGIIKESGSFLYIDNTTKKDLTTSKIYKKFSK